MSFWRRTIGFAALITLGACSLAPDFHAPTAPVPETYKEGGLDWAVARPADSAPRGQWWLVFDDPVLNDLEAQLSDANEDLKASVAIFKQARAEADFARASLFPLVTANASSLRERESHNRPLFGATSPSDYSDHIISLDASYELDVFGRLGNTETAAEETAEATKADLQTVNLSLHAELATDYFLLRSDDVLQKLYVETIDSFKQALDLTQQRFQGGIAAAVDVAEAQAQLDLAVAQDKAVKLARAQLEHAIAVLIGKPSSTFALDPSPSVGEPPAIPAGTPSLLLQRRPDIAAAERRVESANAEIGVARAAYFPVFDVTAEGGYEGSGISNWVTSPSRFWSVGPTAALTVFDAGQEEALNEEAKAAYDQTVANYRGTVLEAYREVEDGLAGVVLLDQEAKAQADAVVAAEQALGFANDRYSAGVVTYLEVVSAQSTALDAERTEADLLAQRMNARVALIKALGGVWGDAPEPAPLPDPPEDSSMAIPGIFKSLFGPHHSD